jgi:hypothetical protein
MKNMGRKINESQHPLDAVKVEFRANYLWLTLRNQTCLGLPLAERGMAWLNGLSAEQVATFESCNATITWPAYDEELDIEEILEGLLQESQAAARQPQP